MSAVVVVVVVVVVVSSCVGVLGVECVDWCVHLYMLEKGKALAGKDRWMIKQVVSTQ